MTNWSGITASLQALYKPSILQPRLSVSSISQLDFNQFKQRGVTGVVIDKDNCITIPHQDSLAPNNPKLLQAWQDLVETFGPQNVLIVSNSAGTIPKDPSLLGAESVSRNLRVPVLIHQHPKPSNQCALQIAKHFSQPPSSSSSSNSQIIYSPLARSQQASPHLPTSPPQTSEDSLKLLVIGDRLITDMILSSRLSQLSLPLPSSPSLFFRIFPFLRRTPSIEGKRRRRIETVGILTTELHEKEKMGTRFLRGLEGFMLRRVERKRRRLGIEWKGEKWEECLKESQLVQLSTQVSIPSPKLSPSPSPSLPRPRIRPDASVSTASHSPLSSFLISTLTRLSSLPHTVPHFLRRLPSTLLSSLKRSPHKLYLVISRSLRNSGNYLLEKLPVIAKRVHGPLNKLVGVYTDPEGLAGVSKRVVESRKKVGLVERGIEGLEGIAERARRRVMGAKSL